MSSVVQKKFWLFVISTLCTKGIKEPLDPIGATVLPLRKTEANLDRKQ